MSEPQILSILDHIAKTGSFGDQPSSRFALQKADPQSREVDTSGLSDEELLDRLKKGGYDVDKLSAGYSSSTSYIDDYMSSITSEEGQKKIVEMYKQMPSDFAEENKVRMREIWASNATRTLRGDILDAMAEVDPADGLKMFSSDYEVAREQFFWSWTATGGTTAYRRAYIALGGFDGNANKEFWLGKRALTDSEKVPSKNLSGTLARLYEDTQSFYKKKFARKANPDPDLAAQPLVVQRGVGGHFTSYSPAPIESWTVDKNTPERFGKQMANTAGEYTILSATTTYARVLFSYESAKEHSGWPEEKELKGKKEFALLGGGLTDLKASTAYVRGKDRWR